MLKPRKCSFFTNTIDYLGPSIRPGKLEIAAHSSDEKNDLREKRNVTELRSFLGLCNAFHRFMPIFPHISSPLNKSSVRISHRHLKIFLMKKATH